MSCTIRWCTNSGLFLMFLRYNYFIQILHFKNYIYAYTCLSLQFQIKLAPTFHVSLYKRDFLVVNSFTFPAEIPQWQGHGLLFVSQAFLVILTGARFLILQRCPSLSMSYSSLNAWEVARRDAMCFSGWGQIRLLSLEASQRMCFSQDVFILRVIHYH